MRTHRVDSYLLTDNLRLEIVHEANPFFAGEYISLVIRIKHLGSQQELSNLREALTELHEEIESRGTLSGEQSGGSNREEEKKPWSMRSLLDAMKRPSEDNTDFSAVPGLEKQKKLREQLAKQIRFHKPVNLMSGYVQISGVFQFDPEVVDEAKLEKPNIKLVGLDTPLNHVTKKMSGITMEKDDYTQNDHLMKYVHSKRTSPFLGVSSNIEELKGDGGAIFALGAHDETIEYRQFPILLIPQTLLFSELKLEPGETKVFCFKSGKLPQKLPPSYYNSPVMSINYSLEVGLNRVYHGDIKQDTIKVPFNLAPYVSKGGCQYSTILNENVIIMEPGIVKGVKQRNGGPGKVTSIANSHHHKKPFLASSFQVKDPVREELIRNFVKLIESNENGFEDIEDLVDLQIQLQFPNETNDEEIALVNGDEKQNEENGFSAKRASTVSSNVSELARFPSNLSGMKMTSNEEKGLIPQLNDLQNVYQINWNGQSITKLVCSKPFYTTSDDIDLVLEIDPISPPLHKVSAVTITLESCELMNPKFVADVEVLKKTQFHNVYDAHAICFDDCNRIPFKLLTPKTSTHQLSSQFKTDVFQLKWMLKVKFVLVPRTTNVCLEQFYEDKKGVLYHAKETLEGEEFCCHIPLTILPSASSFGGW
ncbi:RGP1 (YDR137W) [Zygosaccharomyces parabailii]|nr:RGP1 (YDR137W) [Zygosaccharomyces parabailii]CDH15088.1 related to Reduced growth phenotype protein 1 [Zygosaccharomyces bailii ISA1307]